MRATCRQCRMVPLVCCVSLAACLCGAAPDASDSPRTPRLPDSISLLWKLPCLPLGHLVCWLNHYLKPPFNFLWQLQLLQFQHSPFSQTDLIKRNRRVTGVSWALEPCLLPGWRLAREISSCTLALGLRVSSVLEIHCL